MRSNVPRHPRSYYSERVFYIDFFLQFVRIFHSEAILKERGK